MNTIFFIISHAQSRFVYSTLSNAIIATILLLCSLKPRLWKRTTASPTLQPTKKNVPPEMSMYKLALIGPYDDDGECF